MSTANSTPVSRSSRSLRALCESAIFVAISMILNFLRINILPNGGSIDFTVVPLIIIGIRWGSLWGVGSGFVFGTLKAIVGGGIAYGWQSLLLDYSLAFAAVGLLAGICKGKSNWQVFLATFLGLFGQFFCSFIAGVVIWGEWMPDEFLNMTMTSPWIYSLLYQGLYIIPNLIAALAVMGLLRIPLGKHFRGEDLPA